MIKKNITINFCGRLYPIDEDACELLTHYTETLRRYFKNEGTEEVADDIETRIAELFDDKMAQGANAINLQMTEAVIRQIGSLSELAPGAETKASSNATASTGKTGAANAASSKPGRKLYRDLEHKAICGVCSGLNRYTGIGAGWFRLAFVMFFVAPLLLSLILAGPLAFVFSVVGGIFLVGFNFVPLLLYIICAFVIPPAIAPEDRLRMMGKEVNPQNLAEEVSRNPNLGTSSVLGGCLSLLYRFIALLVGGGAIFVCIVLAIVIWGKHNNRIDLFGLIHFKHVPDMVAAAVQEATILDYQILILSLVIFLGVLIYCCFHAVTRGYGQKKSMTGMQRLIWIGVMILSVVSCFICVNDFHKKEYNIRQEYEEKDREAHTHDGIYFSDTDWEFFQQGHWTLVKEKYLTDYRFTYAGEYPDGDPEVRYLDAYSHHRKLIYRVERTEEVPAGKYELRSLARCSEGDSGAFIYAIVVDKDLNEVQQYLQEIPGYGQLTVDNMPHGWCHIIISDIVVPEGGKVRYGVTTDKQQTGKFCNAQYVSATDFALSAQK